MACKQDQPMHAFFSNYLKSAINRRQLLQAALIGIGAAAVPSQAAADSSQGGPVYIEFPFFPQVEGRYTPESLQQIVSNLLTMEYLHLNAVFAALMTPSLSGPLGLTSGLPQAHFQALIAIHQYQIDFWSSLIPGTSPVTTFTIDPHLVADPTAFIAAGEAVDALRIATDITAVRAFAEIGQPLLAKYAAQTASVDGGIRAVIRVLATLGGASGYVPPVNQAFATDLLLYTGDGIAVLRALGLIGGTGIAAPYPGRKTVLAAAGPMASAVIQHSPNNAIGPLQIRGLGDLTAEHK